jgi:hypothetical protein
MREMIAAYVLVGVGVGVLCVWVAALVEVASIGESAFRAADESKLTWVLLIALTLGVGAGIWFVQARPRILPERQ